MVLIGLTQLFQTKVQEEETAGKSSQVQIRIGTESSDLVEGDQALEEALEEENEVVVMAKKFVDEHPDYGVEVFDVTPADKITIIEHAPKLFKKIRSGIISERLLLESLIPAANFSAMHNFQTGQGKSPSFFFFSDNRRLMIKTLKEKERDILFEDKFLIAYYKHITSNRSSLLSRLLGVYEVRAKKQTPMTFFITENMIGTDFTVINRCWDLKGSLHQRKTQLATEEQISGTSGFNVLKDLNLLEPSGKASLESKMKPELM